MVWGPANEAPGTVVHPSKEPVVSINVPSIGTAMLALAGLRSRFIGINAPIAEGQLVYLTCPSTDALAVPARSTPVPMHVPVIIDTMDDKPLSSITNDEWKSAGYDSAEQFMVRQNSLSPRLTGHPTTTSDARESVGAASASIAASAKTVSNFTFHVATAAEIHAQSEKYDTKLALQGARELVRVYENHTPIDPSIEPALAAAKIDGLTLIKKAEAAIDGMQSEAVGRAVV